MSVVAPATSQSFRRMDASGNGGISRAEFKNAQIFAPKAVRESLRTAASVNAVFTQLDSDRNNSLSATELEAASQPKLETGSMAALLQAQEKLRKAVAIAKNSYKPPSATANPYRNSFTI